MPTRIAVRQGLLAALLMTLAAGVAGAHSFLERADPRPGSTVKSAPSEVRLRFTERLEPAFSTVQVTDDKGRRVDRGEAQTEPGSPRQLRVPLERLGAGLYTVRWRVLSVDSHVVEGDFSFRVAP